MRAAEENRTISELLRHILDVALSQDDPLRVRRVYSGLWKIHGKGTPEMTDVSSTIDEILYGENGAWKGDRDA